MRLRGLGVIEDAVVELGSGLTVVTGETGAGKTMVVTGIGLLIGGRADSGAVRGLGGRSVGEAVVEGRWRMPAGDPVLDQVAQAGGLVDELTVLVSRSVSSEGRSRAYLGGRAVPVGTLSEILGPQVAVHGQSDQIRLLSTARQRAALDRFAGDAVRGPLNRYVQEYREWRDVETRLARLASQGHQRAEEAARLREGLEVVRALDPKRGEAGALDTEAERLGSADALRTAARVAHAILAGDEDGTGPDVGTLLGLARRTLDPVADHDPELVALAQRAREIAYLVSDLASDLGGYADQLDTDPARLAAVESRRGALGALRRAHGGLSVDEVLDWAVQAEARLGELDDEGGLLELSRRRDDMVGRLARVAGELTAARTEAADRFGTLVGAELAGLAMPGAQVVVEVRAVETDDPQLIGASHLPFGPTGVDEVEILLRPHPGSSARPLAKGASGGELSRVMLAVEVVFAGADPVPTFVFDEVDAGIGGRAAVEVGRRLAALARTAQVVVVTHLPQVAAFADQHLVVSKSEAGAVTRADVRVLDRVGRIRELSRMLAGLESSRTAAAHARELLETAEEAKSRPGT
ncbi:MAG: DNA repair protein RecN [Actinomycetes bacterium]